jgi:Ca2+-binding RTX toxin-like protein
MASIAGGADFRVNSTTNFGQAYPSIASLPTGGFVVTYVSYEGSGNGVQVRGRIFDEDGNPVANDFIVNSTLATGFDSADESHVAILSDGRILFTWGAPDNGDGGPNGPGQTPYTIRGRLFEADGSPVANDFIVNTTGASSQTQPEAIALSDGRYAVTWLSNDAGDGSQTCIRARVFEADGNPVGSDFIVNNHGLDFQLNPSIAALSGGRFFVTWDSQEGFHGQGDGSASTIRGRIFNSNGTPVDGDFVVNTTGLSNQNNATVATLANGDFVVTWDSREQYLVQETLIRARLFHSDGTPVGDDFVVNTTAAGEQNRPAVATLADGRFIIAWESKDTGDGSGGCIRARAYNADGTPISNDFIVETTTANDQSRPKITVLADDRVVISWYGDEGATSIDIRARTFSLDDVTNTGPAIANSIANQSVDEDTPWEFQIPANALIDADGDTLSFTATLADGSDLPEWLSFDAGTRTFSGTPPQDFSGPVDLKVTADDGAASVFDTFTLEVTPVNDAPVVGNLTPDQGSLKNHPWSYKIPASAFADADDDTLTYAATLENGDPLPAWLNFNGATRIFDGVPPLDFTGEIALKVTASDGTESVSDVFTLSISTVAFTGPSFPIPLVPGSFDAVRLAALQGGGHVVTWSSETDGGAYDPNVVARIYAADGSVSGELTLNAGLTGQQGYGDIQATSNGFLATWQSYDDNAPGDNAVYVRLFEADGDALTVDIQVSAVTGQQYSPAAVVLDDGQFVVAWSSGASLQVRMFNADGSPVAGPLTLGSGLPGSHYNPQGAALQNGGFVITFASSDNNSLWGQVFDGDGVAEGDVFEIVSGSDVSNYNGGQICVLADGRFVVTWYTYFTPDDNNYYYDVHAQIYDPDGTPDGGVIAVDPTVLTGTENSPDIAALAGGGFIVSWDVYLEDSDGGIVQAQQFDADGNKVGSILTVEASDTRNTYSVKSASLSTGGVAFAWLTYDQNNNITGVDGRVLAAEGANSAPDVAHAIPDQSATQELGWTYQVPADTFFDVNGDPLTYSATLADGSPLPAWLSFDDVTRTFTGTPPTSEHDPIELRVIANDGTLGRSANFVLNFIGVDHPPTVANAVADQSSPEDQAWAFQVPIDTFSEVDGDTLSYSASLGDDSPLPAWLSFNAATRTFSGTPPQDFNGTIDLKVTATDSAGEASDTFTLTIDPVNDAPVLANPISGKTSLDDNLWTYQVPANMFSDIDGDTLILTATLANDDPLPAWLSFSGGQFSGTPPQDFLGTLSLKVTASDGSESVSNVFDLTISSMVAVGPDILIGQGDRVEHPEIAALANGQFIVVWQQDIDGGHGSLARAIRFDSNGQAVGSVFQANTSGDDDNSVPAAAGHADGSFFLAWSPHDEFNTYFEIDGRAFGTNGSALGPDFQINTLSDGMQFDPAAAGLNDGRYAVAYSSDEEFGRPIRVRLVNADGTVSAPDVMVTNPGDFHDHSRTAVAALSNGGFVVAWHTEALAGDSGDSTQVRVFNAEGQAVTAAFDADVENHDFLTVDVAGLADGRFVVTWDIFDFFSDFYEVHARIFEADGSAAGDEFVVNSTALGADPVFATPSVTGLLDGRFVVTWNSPDGEDGSPSAIRARLFNADGSADADDFIVEGTSAANGQTEPVVTALSDGRVAFAWTERDESFQYTIAGRIFDVDNTGNHAPVVLNPIAGQSADEDQLWSFQFASTVFSDLDADGLEYSATLANGSPLPGWLSFNGETRTFSGTPPQDFNGTIGLTVTASDGSFQVSARFVLTVDGTPDAPVVLNPIADQASAEDALWTFTVPANAFLDIDGDALSYSAALGNGDPLPAWLSFDGLTRTFSGTPPQDFNGDIELEVTASDGTASASDIFKLSVTPVGDGPSDIALAGSTVAENSAVGTVVGVLSASDPDSGETFTFSLVDDSGGRFGVSGSNFVVAGGVLDYEQATSYDVTVRVTDSTNNTRDEVFTISLSNVSGVTIAGTAGNDTVNATTTVGGQPLPTGEEDTITGANGNDNIQSLGGNDTVSGGGGDDTVEGGTGDDSLSGNSNGAGGDTVSYEHAMAGVSVNIATTAAQDTIGAGIDTLQGFEHASGSGHNDHLTGNSLANLLSGLDGDDTLAGAQNNDTLDGGAGDDTLEGGIGDDALNGGTQNGGGDTASYENLAGTVGVTVTIGVAGAQNTVGAGLDTLSGIENLTGSSKADVLNGDGGANVLRGLDGNDALNGNGGIDTLDGGAGNDMLAGGADNDTMTGGLGDDTYVLEGVDTVVEADAEGTDTILSAATLALNTTALQFVENLTLTGVAAINGNGNALNNALTGNDANNTLSGGNGDDILEGMGGDDTLNGNGGGGDIASYAGATAAVTVSLAIAGVQNTGGAGTDTLAVIEGLIGSTHNDMLTGSAAANVLTGLGGDDILSGGAAADTLDGGDGNDRLDGGTGGDAMTGGAGNDTYIVDAGADVVNEAGVADGIDTVESSLSISLNVASSSQVEILTLTGSANVAGTGNAIDNIVTGNSGNNVLSGLAGDDVIEGGLGDDRLVGGVNSFIGDTASYLNATSGVTVTLALTTAQDTVGAGLDMILQIENLTGSMHDDTLTGSSAVNVLMGLGGNDLLNGGAGGDTMYGDAGDDTYVLDNAGDRAIEGSSTGGTDTVQSRLTFSLDSADSQFIENLTLTGTAAINGTGNALNNELTGNSGGNTLLGLDGDDVITGGGGRDFMTGGAGEDIFIFNAVSDTGVANNTRDQITDFLQATDLIDLSAIDAVSGGADDAFSFVGTAAFSGTAGELRQFTSGANTIVSGDTDGDGTGNFQIQLNGSHVLNQADFVL